LGDGKKAAARALGAVVAILTTTETGLAPGVTEAEDSAQVVVEGAPEQLMAIELEKVSASGEIWTVYVAVPPALTVLLVIVLASLKSSPAPFIAEI
jgi:hypothetical protein